MFHVGQLVACIDGSAFNAMPEGWPRPKQGGVYEVGCLHDDVGGIPHIGLVELSNIIVSYGPFKEQVHMAFVAAAFRPVSARNVAIVDALKNLPPLDELEPPTPDERPMQ